MDNRQLKDLVSVGPATLGDFEVLEVRDVEQLASQDPQELFERLCSKTGVAHDICCLDVFRAAVEQAKNPKLPKDQCNWWYWSRQRKKNKSS